jgi:hypothetical protein
MSPFFRKFFEHGRLADLPGPSKHNDRKHFGRPENHLLKLTFNIHLPSSVKNKIQIYFSRFVFKNQGD